MKYFRRTYLFIVFVIFIMGCVNRKEQWIEHYAMAKCSWDKEEKALASDSVKLISPLVIEMERLKIARKEIAAPFNEIIKDLENQIKDEQKKDKKEFRKLTDAHYEKYGHVSTPEYEKSLIRIQNNSNNRIASIQKKIKTISDEMHSNGDYQNLVGKIALIEEIIKEQDSIIQTNHAPVFDSLQDALNNLNSNYKTILNDLSNDEKQIFQSERDSIRKYPCMYDRK